jgi:hypothetical protein
MSDHVVLRATVTNWVASLAVEDRGEIRCFLWSKEGLSMEEGKRAISEALGDLGRKLIDRADPPTVQWVQDGGMTKGRITHQCCGVSEDVVIHLMHGEALVARVGGLLLKEEGKPCIFDTVEEAKIAAEKAVARLHRRKE